MLLALELGLRAVGAWRMVEQEQRNAEAIEADDPVRILCLGESTTQNGPAPWPEQLEGILREECGDDRVRVINRGRGGTITALILSRLAGDLERYDPSIVVSMMGINDRNFGVAIRFRDDTESRLAVGLHDLRLVKLGGFIRRGWRERLAPAPASVSDGTSDAEAPLRLGDPVLRDRAWRASVLPDETERLDALGAIVAETPDDPWILGVWSRILLDAGRLDESEDASRSALRLAPDAGWPLVHIAAVQFARGDEDASLATFRRYFEAYPDDDQAVVEFAHLHFGKGGNDGIPAFLESLGHSLELERVDLEEGRSIDTGAVTEHYRQLHRILHERGIRLAAMQYPTLPLEDLRSMLEGRDDVIFVGNEENFSRALDEHGYDALFVDQLAPTFGHATDLANRIIAESAAGALIEAGLVECNAAVP